MCHVGGLVSRRRPTNQHQRGYRAGSTYASARFASARRVASANSPRANFGNAAAAIIAALSVERPGSGKKTGYARRILFALLFPAMRRPALHATPPETIRL